MMNCPECNAEIDYRFFTACSYCGAEVRTVEGPNRPDALPNPRKGDLTIGARLIGVFANIVYAISISLTGMIVGAVFVPFATRAIFVTLSVEVSCSMGSMLGWLSILTGGFLGTVGGCALAATHPVYKGRSSAI